MLCSVDCFPYKVDIYCGKDSQRTTPSGTHVITTMLISAHSNKQHVVFFYYKPPVVWPGCQRHQSLCEQSKKIEQDAALWLHTRTVWNSPEDLTMTDEMAVLFLWDGTITVQSRLPATVLLWHLSAKQKDRLKKQLQKISRTAIHCKDVQSRDGWRGWVRSQMWW